jgi:hypothetical protein
MTTTIRLLVGALTLLVPMKALSQADAPASPEKGRVLLLENERIFEGDIEKIGDRYCVDSGRGQTWVPANRVLRLCASRLEAYEHLRKQANLNDPDELLRLALWCHGHSLHEQAISEVKAALKLRPEHAPTLRLLSNLEHAALVAGEKAIPASPAPKPKSVTQNEPKVAQAITSGLELSAECMGLFARRVQPILMNTCANCHASGRAGEFKLTQVFGDAPLGGKTAQQNLTAVLSQIKPDQPLRSPILLMAASAHGGATQAPLKNRQTAAYKTLEQWVQLTVAHATKGPVNYPTLGAKTVFETVEVTAARETKEPFASNRQDPEKPREVFAAQESSKPAEPLDEFDPVIFNRQMHPDKK